MKNTKTTLSLQLNWQFQNELIDTSCTFLWWLLFWEIKENIAMEKTYVEFHSFDLAIAFLSF